VRQAHFYELLSSMLLFGGIAGWVLHGGEGEHGYVRHQVPDRQGPVVLR
jgi:hypothetical protein